MTECRQFTTDCHSEARKKKNGGPRNLFCSSPQQIPRGACAGLSRACPGLVEGRSRVGGRRARNDKHWLAVPCDRCWRPGKRVKPGLSRIGRGLAGGGGKFAGLRNEPNPAPSGPGGGLAAEISWIGFTAGRQSWSRSRVPPVTKNPPETADHSAAGPVTEWLEVAGNSPDYETNPILRKASREAVLPARKCLWQSSPQPVDRC